MSDKTRRVIRTALQVLLGLAVALPVLIQMTGLTVDQAPWLATVLVVAAAVARAMQSDVVEQLLKQWGLATPPVGPPVGEMRPLLTAPQGPAGPGQAILRHFTYSHLPAELQAVSAPFARLAESIDAQCAGPETTTMLRKLLEAKDCAVRAARLEARGV